MDFFLIGKFLSALVELKEKHEQEKEKGKSMNELTSDNLSAKTKKTEKELGVWF